MHALNHRIEIEHTPSSAPVPSVRSRRSSPFDEAAFCAWIANAEPGASTIYYRGHLAHDRMPSAKVLAEPERKRLDAVADRALQAAEDGLIHLVQRRHGEHDFAYLAIKAERRIPARLVPAAALARR